MTKAYAQNAPAEAAAPDADLQEDHSRNKELAGKSYDEQVELMSPNGAPSPDADAAAAPEEEVSEADRLREAVAGRAEHWDGKEFISEEKIEATRKKFKMANYTTCVDFAYKMMREGTREVYGNDWKTAGATSMMLGQVKADYDREVGENTKAQNWKKAVALQNKFIKGIDKQIADLQAKIDELRATAPKEGEPPWKVKQREIRANAYEKQTMKQLTSARRIRERERDKAQAKVDKATTKAAELKTNNTALIRASDGMKGGRPQRGEYLILSQAPKGGKYGVSEKSKVFLAGGAFKHIAVFIEKIDEPGNEEKGVELWKTIDGGGTDGKETQIYVRLADRMIFPKFNKAKAEAGSASRSQLTGWIDMDELIAMRDRKAAQDGK